MMIDTETLSHFSYFYLRNCCPENLAFFIYFQQLKNLRVDIAARIFEMMPSKILFFNVYFIDNIWIANFKFFLIFSTKNI